jgi:hypothetical protein
VDLGGGDLELHPVSDYHGLRRRQVEQRPDGVVGAAAGAHLEPVPEEDEGGEEGGRLVEDLAFDEERRGDGIRPPGPDRDRDEDHHVERAGAEREPGAAEEDPRGVEDHRQAEQELPQLLGDPARRRRCRAEEALSERRPERDRDREGDGDEETVAHVGDHRGHRHAGVAAVAVPVRVLGALDRFGLVPGERVADVAGHRAAGAVVAALLH